jgi:hypothetical protein
MQRRGIALVHSLMHARLVRVVLLVSLYAHVTVTRQLNINVHVYFRDVHVNVDVHFADSVQGPYGP